MKKSQILAAIALAMALGVVAPVVSAENASAATIPEGVSKADFVKNEVKKLEESFGTVETYNANGTTSYNAGYAYYGTADSAIDDAKDVVTTAETAQAAALQTAVGKALTDNNIATTDLSSALQTSLKSDAWTKHEKYSDVKAISQALIKFLKGQEEVKITTGKELNAENAAVAIEGEIKKADDAIDTAVKTDADDKVAALVDIAEALTGKEVADPTTVTELNGVISTVEGKLPKMAAYRRVQAEFDKSGINAAGFDASKYTERQIGQLVDNMWAAYNGTTITTPSDQIVGDKNDGVNAPATGIAGTAEGTATTVSIVAGLATALTALGAGVVAYRSARRK